MASMGATATSERQTSAGGPEPVNRAHLARYTLGNAELEREILDLFADQSPTYLLHLMAADSDRAWFEAAHALKGSARAVGAWQVAVMAERAEAVRRSADASARAVAIEDLSAALDEARQYIACLPSAGALPAAAGSHDAP